MVFLRKIYFLVKIFLIFWLVDSAIGTLGAVFVGDFLLFSKSPYRV